MEVDAEHFRKQIDELAAGLAGSVDEATGHALDNLINYWSDQWIATVQAEHQTHLSCGEEAHGQTSARTALTRLVEETRSDLNGDGRRRHGDGS